VTHGLDVLEQTGLVVAWLKQLADAFPDKRLVVGSYIYLDGELHVRASVAMDAICVKLMEYLSPAVRNSFPVVSTPVTR
jgi:hypothetical protein